MSKEQMKMKQIITVMAFILSAHKILGQIDSNFRFASLNQLSISIGEKNIGVGGPGIFSTNGFEKKDWFIGLGFGFSNYALQSFPVILHTEKSLKKLSNKYFLYANSGVNLILKQDQLAAIIPIASVSSYTYKSGYWGELGFGHRFIWFKKVQMQTSIGYNYHTFHTTEIITPQIQGALTTTRRYYQGIDALKIRFGIRL